jgi:hypothetical protein
LEILKWTLLSTYTLLIGAIAGFGFSSRKIVVAWYHLLGILFFTYIISLFSSFMGHLVGEILAYRLLEVFIGLMLISLGMLVIIKKPSYPGVRDLIVLTMVVQLDVFLLNYLYALSYDSGYVFGFTISLLLLGSIAGGMIFGSKRWTHWRIQMLLPYVSGVCVVFVGLLKVL